MDPNDGTSRDRAQISTIAVLDLETTNLPAYCNNRVGITELCIHAFDAALLKQSNDKVDGKNDSSPVLPQPPRVVHKLNLLFQPSMMVSPEAEKTTGLSNYLLERESRFSKDSVGLILSFLKHLPAPVCLVAHNGWHFDFPIFKQALEKHIAEIPSSGLLPGVTCLDSLRAFLEIDDRCHEEDSLLEMPEIACEEAEPEKEADTDQDSGLSEKQEHSEEIENQPFQEPKPVKEVDWRKMNETTPKRPVKRSEADSKRRRSFDEDEEPSVPKRGIKEFRSRRQLFSGLECAKTKRFPPRLKYRLGNLYSSRFNLPATNAHQAEADVVMLTSLIQHYGMDFLAFAEEQAIPFDKVVSLGTPKKR
ncbi:hypothetical protein KR074_002449 [Drosophila pseudoananassae]|nr:hypothetical protein KR074_002449 [Drosophila pseudoananassae]